VARKKKTKNSRKRIDKPEKNEESIQSTLEILLVVLFLSAFLYLRISQPWGGVIDHPFPHFLVADDAYSNIEHSAWVKNSGGYSTYEPHLQAGYTDVIGYEPPLLFHLSAMFSFMSGLMTYDTTYLLTIIFFSFTGLLMYYIIKKYNRELAILSLPFMIGIYDFSFELALPFGLWNFLLGGFSLIGVFWCIANVQRKYIFLPLGLFLTFGALTHMPEVIFSIGFIVVYQFAVFIRDKKIDSYALKNLGMGILLFFVLSAYYLPIFRAAWMIAYPFKFSVNKEFGMAPGNGVTLDSFGLIKWIFIGGLLAAISNLALYEDDRKKLFKNLQLPRLTVPLLGGIYLYVIGYTNYVGFENRAWQTRILWPIYLAAIFGIFLFLLTTWIPKWKFNYSVVTALILLAVFFNFHQGKIINGSMDQATWDAFQWIDENTDNNVKIFHFYSVFTTQPAGLFTSKRVVYFANIDDLIAGLQQGVIKDEYKVNLFYHYGSRLPYRKSVFSFGYHGIEDDIDATIPSFQKMEYFVFTLDQNRGYPVLVQYNIAIRDFYLKNGIATEVFNNGVVSILKNNLPE